MTNIIETEILINAPLERVWNLLTDLSEYSSWNPFIVNAKGEIKLEQKLLCQPRLPNGGKYTFRPTVTRCDPLKEFAWTGKVIHSRLACGEHLFQLEEVGKNQVRLIHNEIFTGVFASLYLPLIKKKTTVGFDMMNRAVKKRAEAAA